jgi:hypothetical protein
LTSLPTPAALSHSAAMVALASVVAREPGEPEPSGDESAAEPQEVSGAFLTDGVESGASMAFNDVVQGASDTCAFDATLSAVALSSFKLASEISVLTMKSPTDIVYDVDLYEPTTGLPSQHVEVPVEFDGTFQPGDTRSSDPNEFWPTLFERAYLSLEGKLGLDYHDPVNAFQALTGMQASTQAISTVTPTQIDQFLNVGIPTVATTVSSPDPYTLDPAQGVIGNHSYTVAGIQTAGAGTYVTLRNPWGVDTDWKYFDTDNDGSLDPVEETRFQQGLDGVNDGIIRIPWATFTQYFNSVFSVGISGPSINHPQEPPPTFNNASPGTIIAYEDNTVTLDLSAVDPQGRTVHYALTQAFVGTVNQDGSFAWTPGPNDVGVHQITVKAQSNPWSAASESFFIEVLPSQPTVEGINVSPGTITTAGTDELTLQATGVYAPVGAVVSVDFRVDVLVQNGQGQTQADVGTATAATNWTWTGYLGGLAPGKYTVSAVATSSGNYESAPATATLIVTQAPDYEPPINRAINQVQVSPPATNTDWSEFGTTVDAAGKIRVFYENGANPPAVYMGEYSFDGAALGAPVQLPVAGQVVGRPDGSFDVVYIAGSDIEVQNFGTAGAAVGGPITAATGISFTRYYSRVKAAADSAGDLLIAYSDGSGDVDALTLSASGTVTRAPWLVYSNMNSYPIASSVALDASGAGVIIWYDAQTVTALPVTGAGMSNATNDVTVSQDSTSDGQAGVDANGNITIVYSAGGGDSAGSSILMRRYGAGGTSDSGQKAVESIANDDLTGAQVAVNSEGWALVAWNDDQNGQDNLPFCKLIDPEGQIQTSDVQVPSVVSSDAFLDGVAINDQGKFCVSFKQADPTSTSGASAVNIACLWADMEPAFGRPYQFTVPLGSPAGTVVGTVSATDLDGAVVTYSLLNSSTFAIDSTTGVITVADPTALRSAAMTSYTLSVQATDSYALANVRPVTNVVITVDDPTPPQITSMPDWTIDAGESVVPVIQATDPTGATLIYSATVGGGASATATVRDDELVVIPAAGYTGTFPVTVTATNGLASATTSFQVTVVTPALAPLNNVTTPGPVSVTLNASDASGAAPTYSAAVTVSGTGTAPATFSIVNNVLTITPTPGYTGTFTVTASVSDGADTASQPFSVTVIPRPAITGLSPASAMQGSGQLTLTVNGNNFASGYAVLWNGTALQTHFVGPTKLTATVPAALLAKASVANVAVGNPGSVTSPATLFTIIGTGRPQVTQIAAGSHSPGGLFTIIVSFSEPMNPASVQSTGAYTVLGAVKKNKKTIYTKPLGFRVTYNPKAMTATITLSAPYLGGVQVTAKKGLKAANGQATSKASETVVT